MTDPLIPDPLPAFQREDWLAAVARALKGADFAKTLVSRTADGIEVQPLYPAADTQGPGPWRRAGAAPWRVSTRVDHPDRDIAHALTLADLEGGADALTLAMPGARAARGWGLPCDTLRDLDAALEDVALDLIDIRIEPAPAGRVHAAQFAALVEKRDLPPASVAIDFGMDPVGILAAAGTLPALWPLTAKQVSQDALDLRARGFHGPFLTADGRVWHEAGATAAQELAGVLATMVAYLRTLETAGADLATARECLSCIVTADADQFGMIAKFRAMRRLWARVEEACGLPLRPLLLHAETAWRELTKRDPWVNILRGTLAAFGAGIGGANTITVQPFTAALGLPDAFARRVARNTQLVLLEEANLWRVMDPAAGSGAVEALTDGLCEAAWTLFQEIEGAATAQEPGIVRMLYDGTWQARLAEARTAREKAVATRRTPITGTSEFAHLAETPVTVLDVPRITPLRPSGSATLGMQELIEHVLAGAQLGPLIARAVEPVKVEAVPSFRPAEVYERLRDRSDARLTCNGKRPAVFLAGLGTLAAFGARATFARNLFEAGGIVALGEQAFPKAGGTTDLAALTHAFRTSGATMACLCGTDEAYAAEAVETANALVAAGCIRLIVAGRPSANAAALERAGVRDYIYFGCDAVAALTALHDAEGGVP